MKQIWTIDGLKNDDFGLGTKCQVLVRGTLGLVAKRRIGVPFSHMELKDPWIVPVGISDEDWLLKKYSGKPWCVGARFYDQLIVEVEVKGVSRILYEDLAECSSRVFFGCLMTYAQACAEGRIDQDEQHGDRPYVFDGDKVSRIDCFPGGSEGSVRFIARA